MPCFIKWLHRATSLRFLPLLCRIKQCICSLKISNPSPPSHHHFTLHYGFIDSTPPCADNWGHLWWKKQTIGRQQVLSDAFIKLGAPTCVMLCCQCPSVPFTLAQDGGITLQRCRSDVTILCHCCCRTGLNACPSPCQSCSGPPMSHNFRHSLAGFPSLGQINLPSMCVMSVVTRE